MCMAIISIKKSAVYQGYTALFVDVRPFILDPKSYQCAPKRLVNDIYSYYQKFEQ